VTIARLCGLLFVTGAAALVLEVAWIRRLSLVVGGTTTSLCVVVATFLLCLAAGSAVAAPIADRSRRPLRLFALLEISIGIYAIVFPLTFGLIDGIAGPLARWASLPLAAAIIVPPTLLMGATFPLVCRGGLEGHGVPSTTFGLIAGVNTLGSAVGAALGGLFLLPWLGLDGTMTAAGGALVAAGLVALVTLHDRPGTITPSPATGTAPASPRLLHVAAFASGLVLLGAQTPATRALTFFLGGLAPTYAAVLTAYLAGIGLGAVVLPRLGMATTHPLLLLGVCHLLAGPLLILPLRGRLADALLLALTGTVPFAPAVFGTVLILTLAAPLLLGVALPLFSAAGLGQDFLVGRSSGRVYAAHSAGGALGSLLVGLVLLDLVGTKGSILILASLSVVLGTILCCRGDHARRPVFPASLALLVAMVVIVLGVAPWRPLVMDSHVFRGRLGEARRLITFREGREGAVTVLRTHDGQGFGLYTDGFEAAGTTPAYRYMRMLGHLPALVAPSPRTALVVGFGSGTTAGALSLHELERLDIAEISPDVLDVAGYFREVNHDVLSRAEVTCMVEDGRKVLLRTGDDYDIVTLEPLMPYTPGAVYLYTEDFYRIASRRLREGGFLCQWIPIHSVSHEDFRILLKSFALVFPEASVWIYEQSAVLLGSKRPWRIDVPELFRRCRKGPVQESLSRAGLNSPYEVLGAFVLGPEEVRAYVKDAPIMTDDWTILEYHPLPRFAVTTYLADNIGQLLQGGARDSRGMLDVSAIEPARRETVVREAFLYSQVARKVMEAHRERCLFVHAASTLRSADAVRHRKREIELLEAALALVPDSQLARDLLLHARGEGS
jgi:predicted membrane-bound spermidine synthase